MKELIDELSADVDRAERLLEECDEKDFPRFTAVMGALAKPYAYALYFQRTTLSAELRPSDIFAVSRFPDIQKLDAAQIIEHQDIAEPFYRRVHDFADKVDIFSQKFRAQQPGPSLVPAFVESIKQAKSGDGSAAASASVSDDSAEPFAGFKPGFLK